MFEDLRIVIYSGIVGFFWFVAPDLFWDLVKLLICIIITGTGIDFLIYKYKERAKEKNVTFTEDCLRAINKLKKEFADTYCKEDGKIDWGKLVRPYSAKK